MSEPVGNAPRNPGDIPGNAHREQRVKTPEVESARTGVAPIEEKEPIEKIVSGGVTKRKVAWYKRFGRSLVADDVTDMRSWLMVEIVVPAVRNLLADTITRSTDRVLYGQSRARNRTGIGMGMADRPGLRTRYDKMHDRDQGEPRRMLSRDARAQHNFEDIVLTEHAEAVQVIETLIHRVERYGAASVADLYEYVGVTGTFADRSYGWTDLRTAEVRPFRGGYLLDLPRPEPLR